MSREETAQIPLIAGIQPLRRELPKGAALFRQGDKTFGIFYLIRGKLRMRRVTPDGGLVTLHIARPGEMFAEASLFSERYQCDAVAETDCEIGQYPKGDLEAKLRGDPANLWAFAGELARGLHRLRQRYELKQTRSATERVLQFLRVQGGMDGIVRPAGSLKDIAAELGLSHEALYRALAELERRKQISRGEWGIRLVSSFRGCADT